MSGDRKPIEESRSLKCSVCGEPAVDGHVEFEAQLHDDGCGFENSRCLRSGQWLQDGSEYDNQHGHDLPADWVRDSA